MEVEHLLPEVGESSEPPPQLPGCPSGSGPRARARRQCGDRWGGVGGQLTPDPGRRELLKEVSQSLR